jgi:hypothetical protein
MKKPRKPILVTGSHRSGGTWAGKILALSPGTGYIHEPFNIVYIAHVMADHFPYWFQYICKENEDQFIDRLIKVIRFDYPLITNFKRAGNYRNLGRTIREQLLFLRHKFTKATPIVKDPVALFSADWMAQTFNMNVMVLIRHPAAFCSSLKVKNWEFDFNHFLNQPLLMDKYLSSFEKEIRENIQSPKDIISQGILLWNIFHHVIRIQKQEHPDWVFSRHEDLSNEPISEFKKIYKAFDLKFTQKAKNSILKLTGSHNPVEQHSGGEIVRNSKANIWNWKKRLTEGEINTIRKKTEKISSFFYDDTDW